MEDFDEFCDPENPKPLRYEQIVSAADRIRRSIINTPLVPSHYQREFAMELYYKVESLQRSGSFKERGSLNALYLLPTDKKKLGVVIASLGNEAVGLCYHAQKLNVPVIVVMPNTAPLAKLQQCNNYGAKVLVHGINLAEAQRYARAIARDKGLTYINGRDHPNVLAGYGSVALEIMDQLPAVDAIIVPVGSGGLIAAVATVVKHIKPKCLVYGVQPECMPAFYKSLEIGIPATVPVQTNLADTIAVTNIGVNSFYSAQQIMDKMLLVNDDWIVRAMLHFVEKERYVVEAAAACPLAAVLGNMVPEFKLKTVVAILTGGNIDNITFSRCLERGLAAEGRLVKFRVGIKDTSAANASLLGLIAKGGYGVHRQFRDRIWVENDTYTVEMKFVVEARNLEHALELKRIIERAYQNAVFENEPFNDRRTCPCYVRKLAKQSK